MALDAGAVFTKLGGKLDPSGFSAFTAANMKAKTDMEAAEAGITAAQARIGRSVKKTGDLYQDEQGRWRTTSGRYASDAEKAAVGVENANRRQSRSFEQLGKVAKVAGVAVGAAAVGGALVFVTQVAKAVKVAADFDQELRNLSARSNVTKKQLGQVRQAALDLGTAYGVGARQAAKAATELVKGGLSVQKVLSGGLKGALALAVAGEMDVADAAETMANALNAFKIPGSQAEHVADALATAANATTADVKDMAIALTQGGAAAKAAGLSFDETVAALEALALAGVKGSDAGTSLKSALTQIASPTKQSAALMDDLGLKFFDAQGAMKPLPQIAGMLRDKLGGLTKEQRLQAATTLAGTDGMRALLALYDAGPTKIKKLEKGLKEQGTAAKVAAEQNEGAKGAVKRLSAEWEQAQIIIGEQVLPALADAADTVGKKLQELADDGSLKEMGESIGEFATSVAEGLPDAIDKIEAFTNTLDDIGDWAAALTMIGDAIGKLGRMPANFLANLFQDGPITAFLESARTALDVVTEIAKAVDKVTPGDQSGTVKSLEGALDDLDARIAKRKHQDLMIAIGFKVDDKGLNEISGLYDKLKKQGKGDVALQVVAKTGSAEAAIVSLQALIKDVPDKTVWTALANSQSAQEQVAAVTALIDGVPKRTVTKVQAESKTAQAAVLAFQALAAGVPAKKVTRVLAETNSARQQVNGIIGLINSVPASKTSTITVTTRRITELLTKTIRGAGGTTSDQPLIKGKASGRPAGGNERALIGEGGGPEWWVDSSTGQAMKTNGPMVVDLKPQDYVIPTESRYRSGAMGLLAGLARDMGISGYKSGKKAVASKKKRYVPPENLVTAYSVTEFETREDTIHDAITKSKQIDKNLANAKTQLRRAQRMPQKTAKDKAARKDSVGQAERRIDGYQHDLHALPLRGDLEKLRAEWARRKAELAAAKRFQAQLERADNLANNAATRMRLADAKDDQAGYDTARGERDTALKDREALLKKALAFSQKAGNADRVVELQGQLDQAQLDLAENQAAVMEDTPEQKAADRLADTGMTDAEQAELKGIDKNIALAALTAGLDDDRTAAGAKESFLQRVLDEAIADPAHRGGDATIADLAGQLKQARDSVTSGSDSEDIRAQLAQETSRRLASEKSAEVDRVALSTFKGFQGAGPGGLAPVVNVYQQNLVPGSSDVLRQVGAAAAGGFDVQSIRRASNVKVGP